MNKKNTKRIFKWVIAFGCIIYIVFFLWSKREKLEIAFEFKPQIIFLIMIIHLVFLILASYRYRIIMEKCSGGKIPFLPWFRIFILARFLNAFIPQLGNIYRGVRLKNDFRVSYTRYISGFFSFAWMDTLFNLLTALIVLLVSGHSLYFWALKAQYVLFILIILLAVGPILSNALFQRISFKKRPLYWIHSRLSEVLTVTIGNFSDWQYVLNIYSIGLVIFALTSVFFYIGFLGFGIQTPLPVIVLFVAFYKLNTYINITPGNLGVLEIVYGILSELMGIGMTQGILVSATLRILSYIVLVILGLIFGGFDLLRHRERYQAENNNQ